MGSALVVAPENIVVTDVRAGAVRLDTSGRMDLLEDLSNAASCGQLQTVQELLKRGVNINARNKVMRGDGVGGGVGNEGWVHAWWVGCELGLGSDADKFKLNHNMYVHVGLITQLYSTGNPDPWALTPTIFTLQIYNARGCGHIGGFMGPGWVVKQVR